ncbi:MAG: dihydroorotate dehydrogenase electron transfer subunit [Kiritimatiellia bacterium]
MQVESGIVQEHFDIGSGYRRLTLSAPSVCPQVKPGQFIHLRVPGLGESLLRRPFSIYRAEGGSLSILYKQVGQGTRELARLPVGSKTDFIGPLGNGFPLPAPEGATPVLVAGGYGVAPLYLLARNLDRKGVVFVGGRKSEDLLCLEDFRGIGWQVEVTTEDGSAGLQGRVTDALDRWLPDAGRVVLYACGPDGMLKALDERMIRLGLPGWLSLDKHMGCGVGACLACVQRVHTDDGCTCWKRVCCDGPVFAVGEIDWEFGKEAQ